MNTSEGLKNFFRQAILDHLRRQDLTSAIVSSVSLHVDWDDDTADIDTDALENDIVDALGVNELAVQLATEISARAYTFNPTPSIESVGDDKSAVGGNYLCPKCYRPHGSWQSDVMGHVHDSQLTQPGKLILIVSDL